VVAPREGRPEALVSNIRAELTRFDPQIVMAFTTGEAIVAGTLSRQQLGMTLMLIFGATALALAAIGIYGVVADGVARRRGELATRVAVDDYVSALSRATCRSGREWSRRTISTTCPSPFAR
jgi:putative ABC transport system permease protein